MNNHGVFDLPAPVFDALDRLLSVALPDLARVLFYAMLAAYLSMWMYARISPQRRLHAVRRLLRSAQRRMLTDDLEFGEMLRRSGSTLLLAGQQVWMTLWPSLLIALPLLFLLSWMSNQFDAVLPQEGASIRLCVTPHSAAADLQSTSMDLAAPDASGCRLQPWPSVHRPLVLRASASDLTTLPLTQPIAIIHKRQWWNFWFGNPLGYLPDHGEVDELSFDLPALELHAFGPGWLRHWLFSFLVTMTVLSLWLRWRWKLV